jgi:bifunctional UDP-N-acetylglucosamine pyrophosphorylase / glucosamine-1-phosphate N-acetyltransferase
MIKSEKLLQNKIKRLAIKKGVKLISSESIYLSSDTKFGKNVLIEPYVVIGEGVKIGNNVKILSFSYIEKTRIGNNVTIGPFARLRPDTVLEDNSKIGNFVEIKKSRVGKNSKVNHLSYIGDSILGKNVNVGAGTITCNYDGKNKYKTKILDNAFIGSNSSLVAPLKIGKNTVIGAGSTITKDVKDNTLALSRISQREFKKRKK